MSATSAKRFPLWKRAEDLAIATVGLVILSPAVLAICVAIAFESGFPVFYADERVGSGGRLFRMLKFRTMIPDAIHRGLGLQVSAKDSRITRVGAFLRRWSLDELPQLLNVLRGEMSIVGPRPAPPSQVARYSARHRMRLAGRPGITGLAQVEGRNNLNWADRIERDITYIANLDPWLDLRILARTPTVILRGVGLYGRSGVTPDYDPDLK